MVDTQFSVRGQNRTVIRTSSGVRPFWLLLQLLLCNVGKQQQQRDLTL